MEGKIIRKTDKLKDHIVYESVYIRNKKPELNHDQDQLDKICTPILQSVNNAHCSCCFFF